MLSGSFSGSEASKRISGTDDWAAAGTPASKIAASTVCKKRLMGSFLLPRLRLQHELLHAPGLDFRHDDLAGIAAIHHMNHLEASQFLAGVAESAEDGSVQLHFVNLADDVPRAR